MRSRGQFPAKNTTLNHSKMVNKRQKISNSELKNRSNRISTLFISCNKN